MLNSNYSKTLHTDLILQYQYLSEANFFWPYFQSVYLNFAFKFIAFLSYYAEIKDSVQTATVTIRCQCWYQEWQKEKNLLALSTVSTTV